MINILNQPYDEFLNYIINHFPDAVATIIGSSNNREIRGKVDFFQTQYGVLVLSEVANLPAISNNENFYALKVDLNTTTSQNIFNRKAKVRLNGLGELPDLLGNSGYSYSLVLTSYFTVDEILGKQVTISRNRRDSQDNNDENIIASGIVVKYSQN